MSEIEILAEILEVLKVISFFTILNYTMLLGIFIFKK